MIDRITIDRIMDAQNILDVIHDFYSLRRDGKDWTCLCPFHEDHHLGSFKVSVRKNIYKCFSCGASGNSVDFLMAHEGLSYPDAIRWLGKKYNIPVEGSEKFSVRQCEPHQPPPPLPTFYVPQAMLETRRSENNNLCNWIRQLPWEKNQAERIDKVFADYYMETSREGHAIFWQIDEFGACRTGKMMKYRTDGHRDKVSPHNYDFVHSILFRNKLFDVDKYEVKTTLFGMHLIEKYPYADVNIVESEKTAMIAAIYFGHPEKNIWLATGGLNNLTAYKLAPIMDRRRVIALHPDKDGRTKWQEQMNMLDYAKVYINDTMMTLHWKDVDGPKADLADILVRLLYERGRDMTVKKISEIIPRISPAVKTLIDKMDLEDIKEDERDTRTTTSGQPQGNGDEGSHTDMAQVP